MTSDETQIQIFADWPRTHAKRVTKDKTKNAEYHGRCPDKTKTVPQMSCYDINMILILIKVGDVRSGLGRHGSQWVNLSSCNSLLAHIFPTMFPGPSPTYWARLGEEPVNEVDIFFQGIFLGCTSRY